jgi:PAS domain S-box-containing protein
VVSDLKPFDQRVGMQVNCVHRGGEETHPPMRAVVLARISPDQLAEILDIAEDGIVTIDVRQEIVLFNRGAAKIFGYTPEEVVGQPLDLLLPARFREPHRGQVEDFARSPAPARLMGERREVYGRRKDGTEFPAEVSISKFGTGEEMLFTAIVRDVTERKQHEAAQRELEHLRAKAELADTRAKLDAVIRSAQDAIVILNANLQTTLFNPAAEQVFGYPAEKAAGAHVAQFLPDGLPADAAKSTAPQEVDGRHMDGRLVPLEVSSSRTEVGGEAVHTLILRDVTERKRAEEELREVARQREQALAELRATTQQLWQAARLAGVGELAASIAHELNNPLGTVSLRVEGVLAKTPADDPRRKALEVIEQEVERMAGLVANLLQFSRAGREQVSTVDVCEEVTKTIDLVSHHLRKRQVRVEPDFAANTPPIHADRQQLRQVFLNLFTNAADAMPEGGRLVPRVRTGELPGAIPAIVIEVTDTGGGIPTDLLSRVFDPFFTTKEEGKGTGLGLAICKRIIEQHHGKLEIESKVGTGTTVRVILPTRPETNVASLHKE